MSFNNSISVDKIVRKVIRNNSEKFIKNNIKLEIKNVFNEITVDEEVITNILNSVIEMSILSCNKNNTISINSEKYRDKIIISVEDNGEGIEPKDLQKILEQGYTFEEKYNKEITGRLFQCKNICENNNIIFDVYSSVTTGKKFDITCK